MTEKRYKYPDDWSRKDLAAFIEEESAMVQTQVERVKERDVQIAALKDRIGTLAWAVDRLRELLHLATEIGRVAGDTAATKDTEGRE